MSRHIFYLPVMALALLASPWLSDSASAVVTLTDGNSVVDIDPASQAGVFNFSVDGVDHVFQEWFWFRVGNTAEQSINVLPFVDNDPGDPNDLDITYTGNGFTVRLNIGLLGGSAGSGTGDLSEDIRITNTSTSSSLAFTFFQYADFDINGTSGDDFGWFEAVDEVWVADAGSSLSETDVSPDPTHREISVFPVLLNSLNDGAATTLSDLPGIFPAGFVGPADVVWAFQWNFNIAPGGSVVISKDKLIRPGPPDDGPLVPEPASLAIWGGLAVVGLVVGRLRRKAS